MSRVSPADWMSDVDRVLMSEAGVGRDDLVGPDWWELWVVGATPTEAAIVALEEMVDESARRGAREQVPETGERSLVPATSGDGIVGSRAPLRALSRRNLR